MLLFYPLSLICFFSLVHVYIFLFVQLSMLLVQSLDFIVLYDTIEEEKFIHFNTAVVGIAIRVWPSYHHYSISGWPRDFIQRWIRVEKVPVKKQNDSVPVLWPDEVDDKVMPFIVGYNCASEDFKSSFFHVQVKAGNAHTKSEMFIMEYLAGNEIFIL